MTWERDWTLKEEMDHPDVIQEHERQLKWEIGFIRACQNAFKWFGITMILLTIGLMIFVRL